MVSHTADSEVYYCNDYCTGNSIKMVCSDCDYVFTSLSLSLSLPLPSPYRSTEERLGDVICRLAPFLKLYSHYTSGFEEAMKTLTECTKKDKKFDAIVRDFEVCI